MQIKIAVVGGGAAGIMAAIASARGGAEVTLIEATNRIGNKILLTGNGKCNFSNLFVDESCYYCSNKQFSQTVLAQFSPEDAIDFFNNIGMLVKNKDGYLYPSGEQASIVLDILRLELKRNNISVLTDTKIVKILKENDSFILETENNSSYKFDKVIVATGGRSYPKTGSDGNGYKLAKKMGHQIIPTVPALVQLVGNDHFYKMIAGVRSEGCVSLFIQDKMLRCERGEIQFTDYGISGIPVFQLSRLVAYGLFEKKQVTLCADVLPDVDLDSLKEEINKRISLHTNSTLEEFMCGFSNKKLCFLAIKNAGFKPMEMANDKSFEELFHMVSYLKKIKFHINDTKGYATAQVTAGGVSTEELDDTMQSKIVKGLYFVGEMVDVDGICGGYNLQWAFASGYVAGTAASNRKGN